MQLLHIKQANIQQARIEQAASKHRASMHQTSSMHLPSTQRAKVRKVASTHQVHIKHTSSTHQVDYKHKPSTNQGKRSTQMHQARTKYTFTFEIWPWVFPQCGNLTFKFLTIQDNTSRELFHIHVREQKVVIHLYWTNNVK